MKTMQLVPAMEQGGVERGVVEVNRALSAIGWENVVVSAGGRLAEQIVADGGRHITLDVKSKNPFTYFSRAAKLMLCPDMTVKQAAARLKFSSEFYFSHFFKHMCGLSPKRYREKSVFSIGRK